ncbi:uncharacterized protein LOC132004977 [Mustela nigripes]|uniref:uncharacterized protein LOC132004977 n=1 Tax=Mustela nigripes TaxID=77151 RepID=UPI0028160431|nr:uncharacterized protein LOC132004977 [Mustela nigripes]
MRLERWDGLFKAPRRTRRCPTTHVSTCTSQPWRHRGDTAGTRFSLLSGGESIFSTPGIECWLGDPVAVQPWTTPREQRNTKTTHREASRSVPSKSAQTPSEAVVLTIEESSEARETQTSPPVCSLVRWAPPHGAAPERIACLQQQHIPGSLLGPLVLACFLLPLGLQRPSVLSLNHLPAAKQLGPGSGWPEPAKPTVTVAFGGELPL